MRKEEGVTTANLGLVEDEEESSARRLLLVRDIGVPRGVAGTVGSSVFAETVVVGVAIDNVELGVALDVARRRMPMNGSEMPIGEGNMSDEDIPAEVKHTWQC